MLAEKPERKIVLVGHVDHGKSTLIGRLLYDAGALSSSAVDELDRIAAAGGGDHQFAFLMDHLKEEREQGITIDTTQAHLASDQARFVIIDAPGHKEFLKNMLTGATQADAALLVVDVQEGVREQTRRHAHMLSLVGVTQLVVAINKMDAVDYARERFEAVRNDLYDFLSRLPLIPGPVIPVSARHGDNVARRSDRIGWYRGPCVIEALNALRVTDRSVTELLRFPVQDIYDIRGKRILVGRVAAGAIRTGDRITFFPSKEETTVQSIEVFLQQKSEALQGESIGITVDDSTAIQRGEVAARAERPPMIRRAIQARIFSLSRADLHVGQELTLKLATQELPASLARIDRRVDSATLETLGRLASVVRETEVADVELRLRAPVACDPYRDIPEMGRFVLVEERETVAGGLVLGDESRSR